MCLILRACVCVCVCVCVSKCVYECFMHVICTFINTVSLVITLLESFA